MVRSAPLLLWDAHAAAATIGSFIAGRTQAEYENDILLRSAVERQFEILGEALNQLRAVSPEVATRIPGLPRAVAFRNLLIHGYATVDNAIVWRTAAEQLPSLVTALAAILAEYDPPTLPPAVP